MSNDNHDDQPDGDAVVDAQSPRRRVGYGIGAGVAAVALVGGVVAWSGGGDEADDADASVVTTVPAEYDAAAFCDAVTDLPRVSDALDDMGTPATGFRAYADGLDDVAAVADADTARAATLLADRYRSMAAAVEADAETAPGDALAAAAEIDADADGAAAIETLRSAVDTDC
ncbi:hypothetical protein BDK89_1013 [Ilumatobacter fluminis]|uniref:Uncharacterized protein n=1 Tax=Ilumatobacter fluminis TaxID=467091 RepID=A0A4R7HZ62_9ACTN|nr:hypothetical protein [Ilumatobacter fluminis]TDT15443.1 hypothetical protein BDK89_1013 [Ilumatobacter fluminis]